MITETICACLGEARLDKGVCGIFLDCRAEHPRNAVADDCAIRGGDLIPLAGNAAGHFDAGELSADAFFDDGEEGFLADKLFFKSQAHLKRPRSDLSQC